MTAKTGNKNKNELNNYHVQLLSKRAIRVLNARESAFKEAHSDDTNAQLLSYVLDQASSLGHAPRRGEIEGWRYLEERFGSWEIILKKAHLNPYKNNENYRKYALFQKEFDRQRDLYVKHKKYRKQKSLERKIIQAERRKANEAYLAEHPEARNKKKRTKTPAASDRAADLRAAEDEPGKDECKETE
ncbi:MAG: hypothetical protein K5629_01300 [Eubacteriales bacterium]|nr:hypothetical protein [Eubacteriales bacterium]